MARLRFGSLTHQVQRRLLLGLVAVAALVALVAVAYAQGRVEGARRSIVGVFGVGGVLTEDGALWQYRPENQDWVTIDQAFKESDESKVTKILPLPVEGKEIAFLESFGFLVTRSGECWLYDLENNQWQNIGRPSR